MDILSAYSHLSSLSTRKEVSVVLKSIISGFYPIPAADRNELVRLLLDDIEVSLSRSDKRLTRRDAAEALLALKTLGRDPVASRIISSQENLKILLAATRELRASNSDAADDALRCVANALLLVDNGRENWVEIGGGAYCVDLLDRTSTPPGVFLCSRVLFLSTAASSSELLKHLFEPPPLLAAEKSIDHDIIAIISARLDSLLASIADGAPMGKEAMTDLLKFTFNILCHWPRIASDAEDFRATDEDGKPVLGETWSRRLDGLLAPLLRVFFTLPPMSPSPVAAPMAHILHSLLPIPISDSLRSIWYSTTVPSSKLPLLSTDMTTNEAADLNLTTASSAPTPDKEKRPGSSKSTPGSSTRSSPSASPTGSHASSSSLNFVNTIKGKRKESTSSAASAGDETGHSRSDSRRVLDRALSKLTPRLSLSSSRSPSPSSPVAKEVLPPHAASLSTTTLSASGRGESIPKVMQRAMDILEAAFEHYMPGSVEPDDAAVLNICHEEDVKLDNVLSPLVLLMTKVCKASKESREAFKARVLPPDLDRSTPLEGRADTLGRSIRLMACVHHTSLKEAISELLFLTCNSDAQELSAQIGYGNAAGYLYNHNMLAAPPSAPSATSQASSSFSSSSDSQINPITGTIQRERENPAEEMTQEEKEREAEKLFVLFERLEKAGGMENPIKKAFHEGKLEKYNKD